MVKSEIIVTAGVFRDLRNGEKGLNDLGLATDQAAKNRCFGADRCNGNGVFYWIDQATDAHYVTYVKNGTLTTATEAAYAADKLAGFV